jgi:hypothetical protein
MIIDEKFAGDINARSAKTFSAPLLQESGYIDARSATNFNVPKLQKSGYIDARAAKDFNAPKLQKSGYINAHSAKTFNAPMLQESGHIYADSAKDFNAPMLQESWYIYANSAKTLNAPLLQTSYNIYAFSADTITLKKAGKLYCNLNTKVNGDVAQILRNDNWIMIDNIPSIVTRKIKNVYVLTDETQTKQFYAVNDNFGAWAHGDTIKHVKERLLSRTR